jgi:Leucine-rich repeat (LRR) protein
MLLEVCAVEFPDDVIRAVVNNMDITEVAEEDLQYFSSLSFLDIAENRVSLAPFGVLPALKQLSMQCNVLRKISDQLSGFPCLEILDLSYNALGVERDQSGECAGALSLIQLARIPLLRRLDLACNSLPSIPSGWDVFSRLEYLSLDRNNLQGDNVILALSEMPRLREVSLEYNLLTRIPSDASGGRGGSWFPALELLNLAYNLISDDEAVKSSVELPKLKTLLLYGNPIVDGPQPQDATGRHIPHVVELDDGLRVLEICTMMPDNTKRPTGRSSYKKGQVEALLSEHKLLGAAAFKVGDILT